MKAPRCWLILLALFVIGLAGATQLPTQLTLAQTLGRGLVGYRAAVGITQDSFAKVLRAQWPTMTRDRLSAIENGRAVVGDGEVLAIGRTLDSLAWARLDTLALDSLNRIACRVGLGRRGLADTTAARLCGLRAVVRR